LYKAAVINNSPSGLAVRFNVSSQASFRIAGMALASPARKLLADTNTHLIFASTGSPERLS